MKHELEQRLNHDSRLLHPSSYVTRMANDLTAAEALSGAAAAEAAAYNNTESDFPVFDALLLDARARKKLRSLSAKRRRQIKQRLNDGPAPRNASAMVMFLSGHTE